MRFSLRLAPLLIATLILNGCFLYPKEEKLVAPPLVKPGEVNYDLVVVERGVIVKKIIGVGTFVSTSHIGHYFTSKGGRLAVLHVSLGDRVKQGDLLAELDTEDLKAGIQHQKIVESKAAASYELLHNKGESPYTVVLASLEIDSSELRLRELEDELARARIASSFEGTSASQSRITVLESSLARQKLAVQKTRVNHAKTVREYNHALYVLSLDLDLVRLELENMHKELQRGRLVAGIAGEVTYIDPELSVGDAIESHRTVVSVAEPNRLELEYSGRYVAQFRQGMLLSVKISEKEYQGRVVMTPLDLPSDADKTLMGKVRIRVDGLPAEVSMGESGTISMVLAKRENTMILPKRAVRNYSGRSYVRIWEDGVKKERDVEIGIETDTEVEIIAGLQIGEKVISR